MEKLSAWELHKLIQAYGERLRGGGLTKPEMVADAQRILQLTEELRLRKDEE